MITNSVLGLGLENNFESYDSNSVLDLENIFKTQITNSVLSLEIIFFESQITNSVNLHRFVNCDFNSKFKNSRLQTQS